MDNTTIKYDAIRKLLKTVPVGYNGAEIVFTHISTDTYENENTNKKDRHDTLPGWVRFEKHPLLNATLFIDCHYTVTVKDVREPFITIDVLDNISSKLKRWGKMVYGSKVLLNPKLLIKREGYSDIQVPPPNKAQHYETPLDIMIGTKNENILKNFSGQGQSEMGDGRIEYWIEKYDKALPRHTNRLSNLSTMDDTWTYVEDSKLCFSIDVYISELEFVSYIQEKDNGEEENERIIQYVKEIKEFSNVTEAFNAMDDLIESTKNLGGLVPSNTPLKLKNLSPLSQQLLEILLYFYGDESYSIDDVLPGLSTVSDNMQSEIQHIDDSYVRIQTNVFFKNESITNHLSYYPDSTGEAEEILLMSLLVDWIDENN